MNLSQHIARSLLCFHAIAAPLAAASSAVSDQELIVNLKDPTFSQGVISTQQGGVITAPGLRVQAKKIEYTHRIENGLPVQKITAEGNLMMEYAGRAFVGQQLEYNFVKRTGTLLGGRTFIDIWFLGGEKIELKSDGSYHIHQAYITTSESQNALWNIDASGVQVTTDSIIAAKDIRFRFIKIPLFWLPSFKANLKLFSDPPVKYKVTWDKGLGPRITMRYRILSWQDFELFFRLDYRWARGFGGAIESEYYSPDERTLFLTKNYVARDKTVPDEKGKHRFRLQGLLDHVSRDEKTVTHLSYDRISDDKMVSDFKSDDFEINTQKRTLLHITHWEENLFASAQLEPRINSFQSINQQLPLLSAGLRPFSIGSSGIIFENAFSAGYLDYVFTKDLDRVLSSKHAIRLSTEQRLYRPFSLGPANFIPTAGFIGIFYDNNPHRRSIGQAIFTYGGELNTRLIRRFESHSHLMEPYLIYQGLSNPTARVDNVLIFNIDDGYDTLNLLRAGVRNTLFSNQKHLFSPKITSDLYTYAFFQHNALHQIFPRAYADIGCNYASWDWRAGVAWNVAKELLDYANIRFNWTLSSHLAVSAEYRHRSRFDWRKANHENFIVDVARPLEELLDSPLSDGRNTLLTHLYARLTPKWEAHFQSHNGWGRRGEPPYYSIKLDLYNLIATNWRLKFSIQRSPDDIRVAVGLEIFKFTTSVHVL